VCALLAQYYVVGLFSEVVLGLSHIGNFPTATAMSYFGDVPPLFSLVALLLHLPPLPQLTNLITAATIYPLLPPQGDLDKDTNV